MSRPGSFIVLEGLDGAGTTTQSRLLGDRLRAEGKRVHVTAEPSGGPVGSLIRQALTKRLSAPAGEVDPAVLALLFAADRLDHVVAEIAPRLSKGIDVISDRFTLSSLAYQSLTTRDVRWVEALNARALVPDLTVFLKVPAAVALRRRRAASDTAELYEVDAFQREVAKSYARALRRVRDAGQRVVLLDGERPVDEVAAGVYQAVSELR